MATKSAILAVKIISDAKDFKKGTDEAASGLDKLKSNMSKLTVPALAVGAGLLKVGSDFGKMASDFEQNSGAVDAVFKGMSGQIDQLAAGSAKKLGLSANDYKQYAALIGSQLKNAGVPMDQLASKTDMLLNTGADFAAQFGGTVPDAVAALSSALKGEMDPIEKYGISLSAAKIDAEAAALGFSKVNGALTDQQKQAAILSLINKQGADSQGANAREATTAAGAQARLTAAYEDMGVKLGTALLPIMGQLAGTLGTVVDWISQNSELVQTLAVGLGILAAAILVLNGVMIIMNVIAALNPFVLIAVAVAALIGFIIYLATQTTFFQDTWAAVSKFCADAWNGFVGFVEDVWNGFIGFLQDTLRNIGGWFSDVFKGAQNTVSGVINFFVDGFKNISNAVQGAIGWVRSLFNGFSVPGWLRDVMKFMGVGATGFDMAVGYDLSGLPAGMGATGTTGFSGIFGGGSGGRTEVTNISVTVNGALDPVAVGKQIDGVLKKYARSTGARTAAGGF